MLWMAHRTERPDKGRENLISQQREKSLFPRVIYDVAGATISFISRFVCFSLQPQHAMFVYTAGMAGDGRLAAAAAAAMIH